MRDEESIEVMKDGYAEYIYIYIYTDLAKEIISEARTWDAILDELDSEEVELKQFENNDIDEYNIGHHHPINLGLESAS